jgi:hypothetical protein
MSSTHTAKPCTMFSSMVTGGQTSCSAVHASCCKVITNSSSSWSLQMYDLYPLDLSRQAELMIFNDLTQKSRGVTSSLISWLPASAQPILRRQEAFHVLTRCSQGNKGGEEEEEEEEDINPRVRCALQTQANRNERLDNRSSKWQHLTHLLRACLDKL